jgi:hypothetical protein
MSGASRIFSGADAICLPGKKKGSLVYYLSSDIFIGEMRSVCQVKRQIVYSLSFDILIKGEGCNLRKNVNRQLVYPLIRGGCNLTRKIFFIGYVRYRIVSVILNQRRMQFVRYAKYKTMSLVYPLSSDILTTFYR